MGFGYGFELFSLSDLGWFEFGFGFGFGFGLGLGFGFGLKQCVIKNVNALI